MSDSLIRFLYDLKMIPYGEYVFWVKKGNALRDWYLDDGEFYLEGDYAPIIVYSKEDYLSIHDILDIIAYRLADDADTYVTDIMEIRYGPYHDYETIGYCFNTHELIIDGKYHTVSRLKDIAPLSSSISGEDCWIHPFVKD